MLVCLLALVYLFVIAVVFVYGSVCGWVGFACGFCLGFGLICFVLLCT